MSTIEPELLGPLPRTVRLKKRRTGLGCIRIFIMPHTLVGIGMIAYALFLAAMLLFGEEVPGRVVDSHQGTDDDGDPAYTLVYTYRVGGTEYRGSSSVSRETFTRVSDGGVVRVVAFPLTPGVGSSIAGEPGGGGILLFVVVFAVFWNSILSVFLWQIYVLPHLHRQLFRSGSPVTGTVTKKEVARRKGRESHVVHYQYAAGGETSAPSLMSGKMVVPKEEFGRLAEGDQLTVLYAPRRPSRSLLYRCGEYDVVPA